jgi:capsular exopolysaccharide synthesis family protein
VVDGDLRKPAVGRYLGIDGGAGLTSVLVGRHELHEVLVGYGRENLTVLPSGPTPPNPSELLGSKQMMDLLVSLANEFDIVVIDAPPLLPVTDAAILAAAADGALLVVRHGRTRREETERAVQTLAAVNARLIGSVLNFAPKKARRGSGYDGYGYGYGYGETANSTYIVPTTSNPRPGKVSEASRRATASTARVAAPPSERAPAPGRGPAPGPGRGPMDRPAGHGYAAGNGYAPADGRAAANGRATAPANGHAPVNGLTHANGYSQTNGHASGQHQPSPYSNGYAEASGYADVDGYDEASRYPDPNGYPQPNYPASEDFPQPGGYSDPGQMNDEFPVPQPSGQRPTRGRSAKRAPRRARGS